MSAKKGPRKYWPSWRYGPGYEAPADGSPPKPGEFCGVFNSAEDVPEGWVDHPDKLKTPAPPKTAETAVAPAVARRKKAENVVADAEKAAQDEADRVSNERRQRLLKIAQARFGAHVVKDDTSIEELIAGLGGEAAALEAEKALNGNGR